MDNTNKKQQTPDSDNSDVNAIILFVVVMVIGVVFFFTNPFPGGKDATISGFIKLFFREIVILSILASCFIFTLFKKRKK